MTGPCPAATGATATTAATATTTAAPAAPSIHLLSIRLSTAESKSAFISAPLATNPQP